MEAGQMKKWMSKNHKIGILMTVALTFAVVCLGVRLARNDPDEAETYHLIFIPKKMCIRDRDAFRDYEAETYEAYQSGDGTAVLAGAPFIFEKNNMAEWIDVL